MLDFEEEEVVWLDDLDLGPVDREEVRGWLATILARCVVRSQRELQQVDCLVGLRMCLSESLRSRWAV